MREMIRHERKIELAWECNRYFDVSRWFTAHGLTGRSNHDEYGLDMSRGTSATDPSFFTLTKVANKRSISSTSCPSSRRKSCSTRSWYRRLLLLAAGVLPTC